MAVAASVFEAVSAEHWLSDVLAKLVNGWPAARLDELATTAQSAANPYR